MEKSKRPQRNRRHSRRAWPPEDDLHYPRPAKRLFTPEIKRMLKEWLVRRRENPYPSRDEKKRLAIDTGLTYTQICNWFANWRRKLKNAEREKSKKSWGHLIKNYNTNAKGNVEQFSISSEDSIWEEEEHYRLNKSDEFDDDLDSLCDIDGSSGSTDTGRNDSVGSAEQQLIEFGGYRPNLCMETLAVQRDPSDLFIGREVDVLTTNATCQITGGNAANMGTKTKYKQKMMEKYLRDTYDTNDPIGISYRQQPATIHSQEQQNPNQSAVYFNDVNTTIIKSGAELSKWLESAAKFTPNKNNYFVEWNNKRNKLDKKPYLVKNFSSASLAGQQQTSPSVTVVPFLYPPPAVVQTQNTSNTPSIQQHQQQQQLELIHHPSDSDDHIYNSIHHKDELDAAEALANLAFNCRQRMLDSNTNARTTFQRPLNAQ